MLQKINTVGVKEEELYEILKNYLEKNNYFPVKISPSIKIRKYRPDVVGLRGKEVQCIEVKPEINEYRIMEAITQAKIYMLGATHVFVAFPHPSKKEEKDLLELLKNICKDFGIGIYLIDAESKKVYKFLDAKFSKYLCLKDYDDVLQQLEGSELLTLDNTYPEYIRDLCIYMSKNFSTESIAEEDLIKRLENSFKGDYWLFSPKPGGQTRGSKEKNIRNRIKKTIDGAKQLGFLEVESKNKLKLTYNGYLLAQLGNDINFDEPKELNEKQKAFFTAYLLRFPVFKKSIEILSKTKDFMLLGHSICRNCGYKQWDIKKFEISDNNLLCPKCKKPVEISLLHKLKLEYGIDGYDPIKFTKGAHGKPLDIFEFGRKDRADAIRLKPR